MILQAILKRFQPRVNGGPIVARSTPAWRAPSRCSATQYGSRDFVRRPVDHDSLVHPSLTSADGWPVSLGTFSRPWSWHAHASSLSLGHIVRYDNSFCGGLGPSGSVARCRVLMDTDPDALQAVQLQWAASRLAAGTDAPVLAADSKRIHRAEGHGGTRVVRDGHPGHPRRPAAGEPPLPR